MVDKKTITQALTLLHTNFFPKFPEVTKELISLWAEVFKHDNPDKFKNAIQRILNFHEGTYTPNIATVRKTILELDRPHISGWELIEKLTKWAKSGKTITEVRELLSGDPAAIRTIEAIGWNRICFESTDHWPYLENKIIRTYDDMREAQERDNTDKLLPFATARQMIAAIPGAKKIGQIPEDSATGSGKKQERLRRERRKKYPYGCRGRHESQTSKRRADAKGEGGPPAGQDHLCRSQRPSTRSMATRGR